MSGWFGQSGPEDLLAKLERDFRRLAADPSDRDRAMDFFVTAESLLDWQFPGKANRKNRERARDGEVLLQVASHLASEAKHLQVEAKHHQSVRRTDRTEGVMGDVYGDVLPASFWGAGLFVELDGDAARELGQRIGAVDLAERVLELWRRRLGVGP